ncbi:hypothetical protein [Microbacterium sp. GCS4]|uniref:hypothetical protein n=1 Tax=Microbacterium sp. GCS4 TaxID=1692239 RepID=UPI000682DAFF|nr:hypothetical protein [Microbacterium sp. GCS4]KNY05166.1 hypothetical protein AKH00_12330 [Microbacterium sp. GCS4]
MEDMGSTTEQSSDSSRNAPAMRSLSADGLRSLLGAALLGFAVSFLSSFFTGLVAITLVLACLGLLVLLVGPRKDSGGGVPLPQFTERRDGIVFLATSVIIGTALGGLSLLPAFPSSSPSVPWVGIFDPEVFSYGGQFHWYEMLASILIVAVACVPLFRGQKLFRALSFAVPAVGGAVTAFSAFGRSFSDPVQTFLGWSIAVVVLVGLIGLAHQGFIHLGLALRPSAPHSVRTVDSIRPSALRSDRKNARRVRLPASGEAHRIWPAVLVLGVSTFIVVSLAVAVAQVQFRDPLFLILIGLFAIGAVALCASARLLLNRLKNRTTVFAALASAGVLIALLFAFLQLRPEPPPETYSPDAMPTPRASSPTSGPAAATSGPEERPSPAATPTLISEEATKRGDGGSITLLEAASIKIESWGMRISTTSIFSSWANVRVTTDQKVCEASLHVGESIVMTNRQSAVDDYEQWYEVVLEGIENSQATFAWSVGTGAAPAADSQDSCI